MRLQHKLCRDPVVPLAILAPNLCGFMRSDDKVMHIVMGEAKTY